MASAVQTKKKRDKRKRKEDGPEEFIPQPSIITPTLADDLNIHLHKEATTGGGLCAKLVFFVLLTILSTLIGLIITEHRGLTDLDTINTESAFAQIFEGWIDKFPDPHGHEDTLSAEHSQEDEDGGDHSSQHDDKNSDGLNELSEEENSETVSDEEKEEYDVTQEEEEEEEEEEEQQDEEDDDDEFETRETESATQEEDDRALSDTPEDHETAEEVTNTEEKYEVSDSVASKEDDPEIETARLRRPDAEEMKAEPDEPENDTKETIDSSEKELPEKIQEEDVDETVKESSNSKTFVPIEDSDSEDENIWANRQFSGQTKYDFSNITNTNDWKIRDELDRAGHNLKNDAAYALTLFNQIVEKNPASPRALYGRAQSLDLLAEQKRSNKFLEAAIDAYEQTLGLSDVQDVLFIQVADRCINRLRFRGNYKRTIPIHKSLILKFPENVDHQNELAVTYLTMNNFYEAKKVLHDILLKWPNDGLAMVNYGFILKRYDLNLQEAVKYLKKGISTRDPGVIDGRFYYHLGDALIRLGRNEEAMAVYTS